MARALGLHRIGTRLAYCLVERRPGRPPEVLAAGSCRLDELPELHARLAGSQHLPWGLAEEREGRRLLRLESSWPLRRPATRALIHPAAAAAGWDWELGRIGPQDLFLWLRAERLLWSRGEPGRERHGAEARRGPLQEGLDAALQAARGRRTVALAVEGDAPGVPFLLEELERRGYAVRRVASPAEERGADRAAAGAALAALDPMRPGVHEPQRLRSRDPLLWAAGLLAAATVGGSAWLSVQQAELLAERLDESGDAGVLEPFLLRGDAPTPERLERLLARRRAVNRALQQVLGAAPDGQVEEFELLTVPGGASTRFRLRLLPGGAGAAGGSGVGQRLEAEGLLLETRTGSDGSRVIQGEIRAAPLDPPAAGG